MASVPRYSTMCAMLAFSLSSCSSYEENYQKVHLSGESIGNENEQTVEYLCRELSVLLNNLAYAKSSDEESIIFERISDISDGRDEFIGIGGALNLDDDFRKVSCNNTEIGSFKIKAYQVNAILGI